MMSPKLVGRTADSVRRKLVNQPHAQYPVCGKTIDDVLGYMDSKDILQLLLANENASVLGDIGKHYDKNVLVIPDTLTLSESLTRFREMHDIVGALMGDILYSAEDEQIVRRDATSWLVDGLTPLVDLKKALELDTIPGDDYVDTAAGLVIYALKRIPKKSESITVAGFRFEVLDIDHHKIDQLLVSRLEPAGTGTASGA